MPDQFAYSLTHHDGAWLWLVMDEDGRTVAHGSELSEDLAKAAVQTLIPLRGIAAE